MAEPKCARQCLQTRSGANKSGQKCPEMFSSRWRITRHPNEDNIHSESLIFPLLLKPKDALCLAIRDCKDLQQYYVFWSKTREKTGGCRRSATISEQCASQKLSFVNRQGKVMDRIGLWMKQDLSFDRTGQGEMSSVKCWDWKTCNWFAFWLDSVNLGTPRTRHLDSNSLKNYARCALPSFLNSD